MSQERRRRRLEVEDVGDVAVVKFIDKKILDEPNIQMIAEQLFELVDEDRRHKILLDFSAVDYLSSAALGKLITLNKKIKSVSGQLKLSNIRPEIYEVFEITSLNKMFPIYDDQESALEAFH